MVKVEGADFKYVSFEETAQPRVGDWVIAVGNPFGLGGTATAGIVSAYATTRELAPIAAAIGFAAQAGCRMTAEIGSMRISEEIDALASGIPSADDLLDTADDAPAIRLINGMIAEAARLGFTRALVPPGVRGSEPVPHGLTVVEVPDVASAVRTSFGGRGS